MEDESFSIQALIFIIILVIYILASYYINKLQISFLHQSTVAIFLGFLTALFLRLIMQKQIAFSNQLFFSLLVPPIVFSVGYGMQKPQFFQNFLSISFLGIFSTLFSIFIQTIILKLIAGTLIAELSEKEIILLAIILSSSDPIATLPVLKSNTDRLNAIITGQSVLNCSIVIILFGTVQKLENYEKILEVETITQILMNFGYQFIFSLLLGVLFGFGLSYLFKKIISFSQYHIKETSLILLTGYIVYLSGQFAGLSGIIALFTTSVVFSHYGFKNLSNESQHGTQLAFESIRYIFQAFIFTYLGASLLTTQNKWNAFGAALILIFFNPLIRLSMIYLLSLILKLLKRAFPLSKAETKLLWYSGIVRGVIAFALSLQIQSQNYAYILTTTLLVVMCTTVFSATFFNRFCQIIGMGEVGLIKLGQLKDEEKQIQLAPSTKYGIIGSDQKEIVMVQKQQKFRTFEQKFLKPIFTREEVETKQENTPNLIH